MGCTNSIPIENPDALSTELLQTKTGDYYKKLADEYFDSLDTTKNNKLPKYSEHVVRW